MIQALLVKKKSLGFS